METIEKSIDVDAPITTVYNQWTQFEDFPKFMEDVQEVRQLDDKRLFWRAEVIGQVKEWEAEISEQIADQRIAWRSTSGARNSGRVVFTPLDQERTRVSLTMTYEPEKTLEKVGDALGLFSIRVAGDLKRFKDFIEQRGVETGAWRGAIHGGQVTS